MAQKPSIPKGTRDFSPAEMARRNYIFDTIKGVFKLYGFEQIETPAMENLSTLMGKYGEEGDKLLFKILNSGDFLAKVESEDLQQANSTRLTSKISEKGLRYDLTVPFARFVVQYQNELTFPFRRFQIQPVWRADRPQRGRYREFYQCDVDIVGSNSLLNEVELIQIVNQVYQRLGIRVVIKLNNRKILAGIAETIGEADRIVDITVAIDKLDKIGLEKVNDELLQRGISSSAIQKLQPILQLTGSREAKLNQIEQVIGGSTIGAEGIAEMRSIFNFLAPLNLSVAVEMDLTLARGLNYYTGAIFEVKALDVAIGSITGGGRYDDLTGIFGLSGVSGVGISFGADRIYDVMEQLNLFPQEGLNTTQLMFANFGLAELVDLLPLIAQLRQNGLRCELYPDNDKLKKQFQYADKKGIKFVAVIGEDERKAGMVNLKNMVTGEQLLVRPEEIQNFIA